MLRCVGVSIIIQWKSQINRITLKIILISFLTWSVLANAPKNMFIWKVLVTYYIVLEKSNFNEQLQPDRLNLFLIDVTWLYHSVNILTLWVLNFSVNISYIFKFFLWYTSILCTDDATIPKKLLQNIYFKYLVFIYKVHWYKS